MTWSRFQRASNIRKTVSVLLSPGTRFLDLSPLVLDGFPTDGGSEPSSVLVLGTEHRLWPQASAKQLGTSASIHVTLQHFEPVDLSRDRRIAPRF
jgi:hypothetical protein